MGIKSAAPCRIDLAGGTLDIHPLYLYLEDAATVNLAIDVLSEVEVESKSGKDSLVEIQDRDLAFEFQPGVPGAAPPGGELVVHVLNYFAGEGLGAVSIKANTHSPAGAGLGASSALCVALVSSLLALLEKTLPTDELVRLCLDLEAKALGTPAGYQDFYSAANGGLQEIVYQPASVGAVPLETDLKELAKRIVLAYAGEPHHSGLNNWEIYKRFIDGDEVVRSAMREIGYVAVQMAGALKSGDWQAAGSLLRREWRQRKRLSPAVSTPLVEALITEAEKVGGAGKVCGAGGGGGVILWHGGDEITSGFLNRRVKELGAEIIPWQPDTAGCRTTRGNEKA